MSFLQLCCVGIPCLLLAVTVQAFEFADDEAPASGRHETESLSGGQVAELPSFPDSLDRLIRLNISTQGLPYQLYLDPASLTVGKDRVVRFTTVMVSPSGVWNVTYEGLHCGAYNYRRYAYGLDDKWRLLPNSPWKPISATGAYQYRKFLYENHMCDIAKGNQKAEELVRNLRY